MNREKESECVSMQIGRRSFAHHNESDSSLSPGIREFVVVDHSIENDGP